MRALRWSTSLCFVSLCSGCGPEPYRLDGGDLINVGRRFVEARGCATCHQSELQADGVLSGQREPRPGTQATGANLTPDPATGVGDCADIEIVRALRHGVDNHGLPLCPPMPHYEGSATDAASGESPMSDLEAAAIVAYLRSLPAVVRPDGRARSLCPPLKDAPVDLAMETEPPDLALPRDDR